MSLLASGTSPNLVDEDIDVPVQVAIVQPDENEANHSIPIAEDVEMTEDEEILDNYDDIMKDHGDEEFPDDVHKDLIDSESIAVVDEEEVLDYDAHEDPQPKLNEEVTMRAEDVDLDFEQLVHTSDQLTRSNDNLQTDRSCHAETGRDEGDDLHRNADREPERLNNDGNKALETGRFKAEEVDTLKSIEKKSDEREVIAGDEVDGVGDSTLENKLEDNHESSALSSADNDIDFEVGKIYDSREDQEKSGAGTTESVCKELSMAEVSESKLALLVSIIVHRGDNLYYLYPPESLLDATDPNIKLLFDVPPSFDLSIEELFGNLRQVFESMEDGFSMENELVFDIPQLGLLLGEDNFYGKELTLNDIAQLFDDLSMNTPEEQRPLALEIILSEQQRFITGFNYLSDLVKEGKGFNDMLYSDVEGVVATEADELQITGEENEVDEAELEHDEEQLDIPRDHDSKAASEGIQTSSESTDAKTDLEALGNVEDNKETESKKRVLADDEQQETKTNEKRTKPGNFQE